MSRWPNSSQLSLGHDLTIITEEEKEVDIKEEEEEDEEDGEGADVEVVVGDSRSEGE